MPTRTRRPTAERREEIAEAALEIIGRRGMPALTTTVLAKEIGLTSGALFRHFASREEILDEAVRIAEVRIEATFPDDGLPALERLRELALARVRLLSREPGLAWLLRSEQALVTLPPAAVKRLQDLAQRSGRFIRSALDEALAAGQIRTDVPLEVLKLTFTATVHALIGQPGLQGRTKPSMQPDRALAGLFTLLAPTPRSS